MFLIINPTEKNKTTLIIFEFKNSSFFLISKYNFKRNYHQAEKLLPAIDKLFKKNKRKTCGEPVESIKNLKGIAVIIGPGPFTALRTGVVIANTIAFALKIPVAGIKLDEFKNTKELIKLSGNILQSAPTKFKKIVVPFYDKEPNITIKK